MSIIRIEALEIYAHHGFYKEEQKLGSKFRLDIELEADTSKAEESDQLEDTLNYQLVVELELPEGAHLDSTDAAGSVLERELLADARVISVASYLGRSAPHFYYNLAQIPWSPHFGQIVVTTVSKDDVQPIADTIRRFAAEALPGVKVIPRPLEQGPPVDNPIEVRLYGEDLESLERAADTVLRELQQIEGAVDERHNLSLGSPSLEVHIDDAAAARRGLTRAAVANTLYGKTRGLAVGQYHGGEDPIPVLLRSAKGERLQPEELEVVEISAAGAESTPLSQVARTEIAWRPAAIEHRDGQRVAIVSAQLEPGFAYTDIEAELVPRMDALELPQGISYAYGGQGESSDDANSGMAGAMPVGIILLIAILLGEFNSFRRVGIVLVTVPLAAAGVVPGLLFADAPFGFMSVLGVIALVGIVVNNAIVLIDVIDHRRAEGADLETAVREGVERRARPILLTTTTTVSGLLPLALSGSSLWPPMAWSIISGLIASTLLTLLAIPSLYLLLFRRPRWLPGKGAVATAVLVGMIGLAPISRAQEPGSRGLSPIPDQHRETRVTLAEAMARAVDRPAMAAADRSTEAAEEEAEAVRRAGLLPVVGTRAVTARRDEAIVLETPLGPFSLGERDTTTVDVRVTQPIYDPVNRRGDLPAARALASAERERASRTREELAFAAAEAYLNVLAIDARIAATDAFLTSLGDRLREMRARVRLGRTIESEALKVELDLAEAERDRAELTAYREVATWQLGRAIGAPGSVEPADDPTENMPEPRPDAFAHGPANRGDIHALAGEALAAEAVGKAVRAERLPVLEAVAEYGWADGDPFRDGSQWQVAVQASWSPFAAGTRKPRIAAAKARAEAIRALRRERELEAEHEMRLALAGLRTARKNLEVATRSVALAEETRRVERRRYDEGRATTNDLLEAEADLRDAKAGRDVAELEIVRADLVYKLAAGEL